MAQRVFPRTFPRSLRRGFCGILSLLTVLSCLPRASALPGDPPVVDDGVQPTYDEAYYATTDYYGNLTEGSVVKSYTLNGAASLTDNGYYDQVTNLTDGSDPVRSNGTVTFRFDGDAPSRFYFEGKTAAPFRNLPWRLSVHYALNGVAMRAEDLAGKTGVVEIVVDAAPNEGASEYARNNYILACNAIFNQDDILSLEAPGAQLQLIGNLRTALFLAFPGEEQQFVMRVGTEDFSFGGLTIMLMPATLSQLEEIAKLSEKKDDLEDSYHKLSDSLDAVLDAFGNMKDSLNETADGLDALDKARRTVSDGKDSIYRELDQVQGDLTRIATALDPVAGLAGDASRSLTETKAKANVLVDTALGLREDLAAAETSLGAFQEELSGAEGALERLEECLEALEWNLEALETSLNRMEEHLAGAEENLDDLDGDLEDLRRRLSDLAGTLDDLQDRMEELDDNLDDLQDNEGRAYDLTNRAGRLKTSLNSLRSALANVRAPSYTGGSSRSGNLAQVVEAGEKLEPLFKLTADQEAQEAAFFTAMLMQQGRSQEEAAAQAGQLMQFGALLADPEENAEAIAAADPDGTLTAAYRQLYGLYSMKSFPDFFQAILVSQGYSESDAEQAARLWRIYESNDRSLAALELVMETADDVESSLGNTGSQVTGELRKIAVPASTVLGDLSGLCGDLESLRPMLDDTGDLTDTLRDTLDTLADLSDALGKTTGSLENGTDTLRDAVSIGEDAAGTGEDLLDTAESLSANLRDASSTVRKLSGTARTASDTARELMDTLKTSAVRGRELLEDTDSLRVTLNDFEPVAQKSLKALGDLSDSAAAAVRNANRAITAAENVTKPAGRQLDEGTKQSLDGLSSTLRNAADGLDTTTDLRDAKDTVTKLIEDTWDEYTGDVNNLLLMDAAAEAESLTSAKNPAPQSVQVLIRTQEIEKPEDDENENDGGSGSGTPADSGKPTTFLGRVGKMFRDLWGAVTGLFR